MDSIDPTKESQDMIERKTLLLTKSGTLYYSSDDGKSYQDMSNHLTKALEKVNSVRKP
jgi:hypothetical protein